VLLVGIDWAERHHDVCLMAADGSVLARERIPDGVAGVARPHELIADHASDLAEVVVGIETDRGAAGRGHVGRRLPGVCGQPAGRGPLPRPASRRGLSRIGDAKVLADLVRTDRHNHRQVAGDSPLVEAVKMLARAHQSLIWARQRQANGLRSALREFYRARWLPWARSWPSPRPWRCWRWRPPLSRVVGSPERPFGERWWARAGVATCRPGWWPSMMGWRRRSWPQPIRSRVPIVR
jgi:transposase